MTAQVAVFSDPDSTVPHLIGRHATLLVMAADEVTALWNTECVIPPSPKAQAVSNLLHAGPRDVCVCVYTYINFHFITLYQKYSLSRVLELSTPFCFADQNLAWFSHAFIVLYVVLDLIP
jgi:hypothetical protein